MAILLDIPFTPFADPELMLGWLRNTKQLIKQHEATLSELELQGLERTRDVVTAWYEQRTGTKLPDA